MPHVTYTTACSWVEALKRLAPVDGNHDDPSNRKLGFQSSDGDVHFISLADMRATDIDLTEHDRALVRSPKGRRHLESGGV